MTNNTALFAALSGVSIATNDSIRTPMTKEQVTSLSAKLKAGLKMNVYPNSFDVKKPYRVSIRYNQEFHAFGNFTHCNTACLVGNIAGLSMFGAKALASAIDMAKAQADPEFLEWLEDPRNTETIAKASNPETATEEQVPF